VLGAPHLLMVGRVDGDDRKTGVEVDGQDPMHSELVDARDEGLAGSREGCVWRDEDSPLVHPDRRRGGVPAWHQLYAVCGWMPCRRAHSVRFKVSSY
jgi:hypothetical protein